MVLCIGMFFLPFSPRWLIERGRYDEAYEVVKRLHFDGKDETFFKAEFHQMKEQIVYEQEHEVTDLKSFFTNPSYRKRLIIACGVQAGNQFTGINCINYYQTSIYASLGQTGYNVLLLAMAYGTIGTICTFISTYKVDKWGRVKTMLISCILLSFIFVLVTVLIGVYGESDNAAGKGAVIAMIYVFVIMYVPPSRTSWATSLILPVSVSDITVPGLRTRPRSSRKPLVRRAPLPEPSHRSLPRFCWYRSPPPHSRTLDIGSVSLEFLDSLDTTLPHRD
jgi:Na+/melibiose symporter-like transporter